MAAMMLSSLSSASFGHMLDTLKPNPHLYLCQPHTIQIIQLVEASPPPRQIPTSDFSSSCPSTSDTSSCSSYCSSAVTPDHSSHDREPVPWTDDTYPTRMKRVHAWRDGCPPPDPRHALKRKSNPHQPDEDAVAHAPKRARSRSISRLTGHPCPACDALFPSDASLRKHGGAPSPEACRVAVEYHFE